MIIKCAWCGKFMGIRRPLLDFSATHGMCVFCGIMEFLKLALREEREKLLKELHKHLKKERRLNYVSK